MAEGGSSKDDRFVQRLKWRDGNVAASWNSFKAQLKIYMIAKKFSDMSDDEQIANVLLLMGAESVPIYEQFIFDEGKEDQKKNLTNVLKFFDRHFEPVKNVIYERVKFNSMVQGELSIHQFITNIQTQADVCEYGTMRLELIRDRIIVGVKDNRLREYLIDLEDNSLHRCIEKAKQYVSQHEQSARMNIQSDVNMDAVNHYRSRQQVNFNQNQVTKAAEKCFYCPRGTHKPDKCPARKSTCRACHKKGHWALSRACKASVKSSGEKSAQEVTEDLEGLFLGSDSD